MYSTDKANSIKKKDIKYIPAGIIADIKLKSSRVGTSPNGLTFLEIIFEKDGSTLTHTEYAPKKGLYVITDDDLEDAETRQLSRMLQILHCYYSEEETTFTGQSFNEFAEWLVSKLEAADKNKLLRIKVVYNKKGFTSLPAYSKYTFIEPMELPEGQTSAIVELGIDQFTKPIIADQEKPVDPMNVGDNISENTTEDKGDELPF